MLLLLRLYLPSSRCCHRYDCYSIGMLISGYRANRGQEVARRTAFEQAFRQRLRHFVSQMEAARQLEGQHRELFWRQPGVAAWLLHQQPGNDGRDAGAGRGSSAGDAREDSSPYSVAVGYLRGTGLRAKRSL